MSYKRPTDYWCNDDEQVKIIEAALDLYEKSLRPEARFAIKPGRWYFVYESDSEADVRRTRSVAFSSGDLGVSASVSPVHQSPHQGAVSISSS